MQFSYFFFVLLKELRSHIFLEFFFLEKSKIKIFEVIYFFLLYFIFVENFKKKKKKKIKNF